MGARVRTATIAALALTLSAASAALGSTSHRGWPQFDGQRIMHSADQNGVIRPADPGKHNELLGGNGNDTIYAGDVGDVIWGDYKPHPNGTQQHDRLYGGKGKDFIYASHGYNLIVTGGGADQVHAHYGRGVIRCTTKAPTIFLSHRSRHHYKLHGCRHISFKTVGH